MGTFAPRFHENFAIFFESVETITSPIFAFKHALILWPTSGSPFKILIFLFFTLVDPDLAGIIINNLFIFSLSR